MNDNKEAVAPSVSNDLLGCVVDKNVPPDALFLITNGFMQAYGMPEGIEREKRLIEEARGSTVIRNIGDGKE